MKTENNSKKLRGQFKTSNKFQEKIILLSFLPSAALFLTFITIVFLGTHALNNQVAHSTYAEMLNTASRYSNAIVICMCLVFIIFMVISFLSSQEMIGAHVRILRELDEVLEGKRKSSITVRPGDEVASELLKRVNVLIKFYVDNKKNNA